MAMRSKSRGLEIVDQAQENDPDHHPVSDDDDGFSRMADGQFLEKGEHAAANIGERFSPLVSGFELAGHPAPA